MSITFSAGLSIRNRASVPGVVLYVRMIEFLGSWHHCIKRFLENPHSKSGWLARTTFGLGTRAKSESPWQRERWRNWKGLFLLSSKHLISLSLIHSTCMWGGKNNNPLAMLLLNYKHLSGKANMMKYHCAQSIQCINFTHDHMKLNYLFKEHNRGYFPVLLCKTCYHLEMLGIKMRISWLQSMYATTSPYQLKYVTRNNCGHTKQQKNNRSYPNKPEILRIPQHCSWHYLKEPKNRLLSLHLLSSIFGQAVEPVPGLCLQCPQQLGHFHPLSGFPIHLLQKKSKQKGII